MDNIGDERQNVYGDKSSNKLEIWINFILLSVEFGF